jgi:DUF4097 and DUF4098 domain-containing protein YvlB
LFLFATVAPCAVLAQEASLLAEEALGVVPVEGDLRRIVVSHVKGSVTVQLGVNADEIRFLSYTADDRHLPLPIAVWSEGTTLRFEPAKNAGSESCALEIHVPEGLDVMLDLEKTKVDANALPGGLEVHGKGLALKVGGVRGSAVFNLLGGTAVLGGVAKSVDVTGKDVDLQVIDMPAQVALHLVGGTAKISGVSGSIQADTEGTALSIQESGAVTAKAHAGRVDLLNVLSADLSLTGAALMLTHVRGEAKIQTDAGVSFSDTQSGIRVEASGGAVRGSGSSGAVEIKTRNADVTLEHVSGSVRVEGDGLKVKLNDVTGEIAVLVQDSDVEVTGNQKALTIDDHAGGVIVRDSQAPVTVRAVGGTVGLLDLRGSVELHADLPDAEVSWALLPGDKDSVLQNVGGGLKVQFPPGGSCRIEARSKGGRIDSDLEHVVVSADGNSATGLIGAGGGRTIRVDADWNILLTGGLQSPEEQP